jgi:UDP-N-acetylglucosamine 2-epimerase (non-hydrolysing)
MDGLALTECRIAHSALKTQFDLVTLVIVERSVRAHLSREVDDGTSLRNILKSLLEVNEQLEVFFSFIHGRAYRTIRYQHRKAASPGPVALHRIPLIAEPRRTGYCRLRWYSGGTTYLGVPCLTLRSNTERPVTVSMGTNILVGQDLELLNSELARIPEGKPRRDRYRHCRTVTRGNPC